MEPPVSEDLLGCARAPVTSANGSQGNGLPEDKKTGGGIQSRLFQLEAARHRTPSGGRGC